MRIIYDTNVLLQILRDDRSISRLQTIYNLYDVEESISLVTVAEIRSFEYPVSMGCDPSSQDGGIDIRIRSFGY